jgi:hypothetical protein
LNPAPSKILPASLQLGSRLNQRAKFTGLATGSASSTAPPMDNNRTLAAT